MTVLAVLTVDGYGGFGEHLTLFCLSFNLNQTQRKEATVTVLTVSAIVAVSVMTATILTMQTHSARTIFLDLRLILHKLQDRNCLRAISVQLQLSMPCKPKNTVCPNPP